MSRSIARRLGGFSASERMTEAKADFTTEDGIMHRNCLHTVRHPVGHIKGLAYMEDSDWKHTCCSQKCCQEW